MDGAGAHGEARLTGVAETLLIPLAARAEASRAKSFPLFDDPVSELIALKLGEDLSRFVSDRSSMRGSIVRTLWFDMIATAFLCRHPKGLCVNLGAGLDPRGQRIQACQFSESDWIDVDCGEVVRLREKLIPAAPRVRSMAGNLTTPRMWGPELPWANGRPLLVMAEGVFMYLREEEVRHLLREIFACADRHNASVELAFDYASPFMARYSGRNQSVAKTNARFHWGLERPSDLKIWDGRMRVAEHFDVAARSGLGPALLDRLHMMLTFGRHIYGCARFVRSSHTPTSTRSFLDWVGMLSPFAS